MRRSVDTDIGVPEGTSFAVFTPCGAVCARLVIWMFQNSVEAATGE